MSALHELDITREHCPMTFVKTKLKLAQIANGDHLKVRLKKGEPLRNVPRSAEEQGYHVISVTEVTEEIYEVVIEKPH